ncbi:hypothetical protein B0H15DRAFT_803968 [Mycena belliarum]|uniref:Uncharacterized protein n=1 Tax=Mycena belliarum TaxID=1033014 RepID=A0AAD6TWM9_9AGAR|nr:hypothetical protein B0H15DRAFT_803968 [Mycena belliae]
MCERAWPREQDTEAADRTFPSSSTHLCAPIAPPHQLGDPPHSTATPTPHRRRHYQHDARRAIRFVLRRWCRGEGHIDYQLQELHQQHQHGFAAALDVQELPKVLKSRKYSRNSLHFDVADLVLRTGWAAGAGGDQTTRSRACGRRRLSTCTWSSASLDSDDEGLVDLWYLRQHQLDSKTTLDARVAREERGGTAGGTAVMSRACAPPACASGAHPGDAAARAACFFHNRDGARVRVQRRTAARERAAFPGGAPRGREYAARQLAARMALPALRGCVLRERTGMRRGSYARNSSRNLQGTPKAASKGVPGTRNSVLADRRLPRGRSFSQEYTDAQSAMGGSARWMSCRPRTGLESHRSRGGWADADNKLQQPLKALAVHQRGDKVVATMSRHLAEARDEAAAEAESLRAVLSCPQPKHASQHAAFQRRFWGSSTAVKAAVNDACRWGLSPTGTGHRHPTRMLPNELQQPLKALRAGRGESCDARYTRVR